MQIQAFKTILLFALIATACCSATLYSQVEFKNFDASDVFQGLEEAGIRNQQPLVYPWWNDHVTTSLRQREPVEADIHSLLFLAIHNSNNIKIASRDPLIRHTAIREADSEFDWIKYLDSAWNDTSEPTGSILTAGTNVDRFDEQSIQLNGGLRKRTRNGGQFDISQRLGWLDNNSTFLTPPDQATGRFLVSYTHPLLRGSGYNFNNSLVVLARIDAEVAENEFLATLQDELLEIVQNYWALYLERARLAHRIRLYLKTEEIYRTLSARQVFDAQQTQIITAESALENRRADLIRARTEVANAETRLRGLINAPELLNSDVLELIPVETPATNFISVDLQNEVQIGIQNRPEVHAAILQVKAGSERLGIAQHELMPVLNLVTSAYANGLRGNFDSSNAFTDQFTRGRPSYSIGVQYELPVGNRLARARVCRRQHELAQLQDQYARALEAIQTEVDIAVRELNTAHAEINAKSRALAAAEAETATIEERWRRMADGSGSAALNLESLLRAQERVTEAESQYVQSILTYNLASITLKRANGTLLQSESVIVGEVCQNGCKDLVLDKEQPQVSEFPQMTGQPITEQPYQDQQFYQQQNADPGKQGQFDAEHLLKVAPEVQPLPQTEGNR